MKEIPVDCKSSISNELISAQEFAELLPDCSSQTVYRWAKDGKIPFIVLPSGRKFFRRRDALEILQPVQGDLTVFKSGREVG